MMGALKPFCSASAKNVAFTISRWGRPKEMLETPRIVRTPRRSRIPRTASSVVRAPLGSELMVMQRASMTMSLLSIPYSAARRIMRSAMAMRASAVSGIPPSSSVSATSTPPYLAASGNTASMTSLFPLTELIMGFPL